MTEERLNEWNDTISVINKKVISLDNDKVAQHNYIDEQYFKLLKEFNDLYEYVISWHRSQLTLLGVQPLDFMYLYPSIIDMSKIKIDDKLLNKK